MPERPIGIKSDASGVHLIWRERTEKPGVLSNLLSSVSRIGRERFDLKLGVISAILFFTGYATGEIFKGLTSTNPVSDGSLLAELGVSIAAGVILALGSRFLYPLKS